MNIKPIDRSETGLTAGQLKAGDVFVLNAQRHRILAERRSYLVMWPHTRLAGLTHFRSTSKPVVCVQLHNGKFNSFNKDQQVLQLDDDEIELAIKEEQT